MAFLLSAALLRAGGDVMMLGSASICAHARKGVDCRPQGESEWGGRLTTMEYEAAADLNTSNF